MVDDLRSREVGLKVLAGAGAEIDTTTTNGRLVFGIFAALAEFERELIAERTRAGLAAAGDQLVFCLSFERLETLQVQYARLVAKPTHLGITVRCECIERKTKCPGDIRNVATRIGIGGKEPSRRPEITVGQKEPDPVHRTAQALCHINDEPGKIEVSLAFRAVENRRMIKARLFGRTQNAHSGHVASR